MAAVEALGPTAAADAARTSGRMGDALQAYLFLGPFLLVYAVFLVYPPFKGVWISLHDWELVGAHRQYIGFAGNTILFVLLTVPAMTVLSLALALAVHRPTRLNGVMRGIFFGSSVFSVSVVTLVWQMVLNGDRGLLAHLFRALGRSRSAFSATRSGRCPRSPLRRSGGASACRWRCSSPA